MQDQKNQGRTGTDQHKGPQQTQDSDRVGGDASRTKAQGTDKHTTQDESRSNKPHAKGEDTTKSTMKGDRTTTSNTKDEHSTKPGNRGGNM